MSGFGFSPTDVANGISIVVKARRALRATGGSAFEYQQAVQFLSSLELTLKSVHETVEVFRKQGQITVLEDLAKKIERPLHSLLTSLKRFEAGLGSNPQLSTIHSAYAKLHWAFEISRRVKELQDQLTLPLLTVNLNIAILSSTTLFEFQASIPAAVCAKFQETISSEAFVQTQKDLIDAQISRQIPDDKLSRELQLLATSIPKLLNEGILRYETLLKDDIDQQKQLTNDLAKAMDSMRELNTALHRSTTTQATPRQKNVLARRAFVLSIGLRILLQQVFLLLDPRTKALLARMTTALVTVPRVLMTESIFFHDVLGYTHTLPFDYFRDFKILDCWLRDSLYKRPGAQRISESQYRLLQQSSNSLIKHTEWEEVIKPNETILMSIVRDVVPAEAKCCPRCRSSSTKSSTTEGQECASCLLYYYPDPSAQYELELWKDNFYGLQDRTQSTLFDHGEIGVETEAIAVHTRNPDISSFKRVHTREVDLPALWLETIFSLLGQILDCQRPDTDDVNHTSSAVSQSFAILKSLTKNFYESTAILTALSPAESTFWRTSDFRQHTAKLFAELRELLLALRNTVEMNLQSVSEESQIVSDVQQRLRKYTANIFESGSAPLSAISSLHKVRGKLSSDLKSYDHLLEVMKDYHIQVVTIQEVLDAFSDKLGEASTYDDADMNTIITTLVNAAKESHIPVFDGTINHLVTGTYEDKTSTVSASVFAQDRCKVPQSPHRSTGTWSADKDEVVHKDKDHQRAGASPRNSALQRGHKILDIADGCDILWKARAKVNNDSDDNADDDRYPGGTVSEYRSYVYSKRARQPEYFLPAEGLNREVLQHEITRYLGQDTIVRPTTHEGRPGYLLRAYRPLTPEMIRSLKEASIRFEREKLEKARNSRTMHSYAGSGMDTYDANAMKHDYHRYRPEVNPRNRHEMHSRDRDEVDPRSRYEMHSRYRHEVDPYYRHMTTRETPSYDGSTASRALPQPASMKATESSNLRYCQEVDPQHHPRNSGGAPSYDPSMASGRLLQPNSMKTSETPGPRISQTLDTATPTTYISDSAIAAQAAQAAWARK